MMIGFGMLLIYVEEFSIWRRVIELRMVNEDDGVMNKRNMEEVVDD